MMHIRSRPSCGGGVKPVVLNLGVALDDVRYPRVKKFGRHDRRRSTLEVREIHTRETLAQRGRRTLVRTGEVAREVYQISSPASASFGGSQTEPREDPFHAHMGLSRISLTSDFRFAISCLFLARFE